MAAESSRRAPSSDGGISTTRRPAVTTLAPAVCAAGAAFITKHVGVTVIVGVLQAVGAVSIGFAYPHSAQVGLYIGGVVALLGFLGPTQDSPLYGAHGFGQYRSSATRPRDLEQNHRTPRDEAGRFVRKKAPIEQQVS